MYYVQAEVPKVGPACIFPHSADYSMSAYVNPILEILQSIKTFSAGSIPTMPIHLLAAAKYNDDIDSYLSVFYETEHVLPQIGDVFFSVYTGLSLM